MYDENNKLNEIDSSFDRVEEFHEVSRYHGWPGFCKVLDSRRVEKRQKVFDTRWQIELKGGSSSRYSSSYSFFGTFAKESSRDFMPRSTQDWITWIRSRNTFHGSSTYTHLETILVNDIIVARLTSLERYRELCKWNRNSRISSNVENSADINFI